ncbi:MAG: endopeptidase La, partial [Anaerolineales bacterium]|nr:endopeptidase La [Anaerolineales bacterium]
DEVGIATALAWTENGGDIMPVEVALVDGKGNLQITGQVGEVMQEYAQAEFSYLKSRASQLKLKSEVFESTDIHIHIPEGSIPKDGPSAGITIGTALISAFTQLPIRREVAMTGEITLRGRVLPVGGVREKIMAAHRAGLKKVIIPKLNTKDLIDLPKRVRTDIRIMPVDHMDQVLEIALLMPQPKPAQPSRAKRAPAPPRDVPQEDIRPIQY